MVKSIVLAAALLLCGQSMSASFSMVEQKVNAAPVEMLQSKAITAAIEKLLIEQHAAPYWNLTIAQAWELYHAREIIIIEIEPNYSYRLVYGDGILDVLIDPSSN